MSLVCSAGIYAPLTHRRSALPPLIVLCGYAGAGKTELLGELAARGEQTLDLEMLACHSGSVFGGVGRPAQPSHSRMRELVEKALGAADPSRPIWVEDEGPFIGAVGVPERLQAASREAPAVQLELSFERRVDRLAAEYGRHPRADLARALHKASARLGRDRTRRALSALDRGRIREAVEAVLPYYDSAYRHRTGRYDRPLLAVIDGDGDDPAGRAAHAAHVAR